MQGIRGTCSSEQHQQMPQTGRIVELGHYRFNTSCGCVWGKDEGLVHEEHCPESPTTVPMPQPKPQSAKSPVKGIVKGPWEHVDHDSILRQPSEYQSPRRGARLELEERQARQGSSSRAEESGRTHVLERGLGPVCHLGHLVVGRRRMHAGVPGARDFLGVSLCASCEGPLRAHCRYIQGPRQSLCVFGERPSRINIASCFPRSVGKKKTEKKKNTRNRSQMLTRQICSP